MQNIVKEKGCEVRWQKKLSKRTSLECIEEINTLRYIAKMRTIEDMFILSKSKAFGYRKTMKYKNVLLQACLKKSTLPTFWEEAKIACIPKDATGVRFISLMLKTGTRQKSCSQNLDTS